MRGKRSRKRPWSAEHTPLDPARIGSIQHSERGPGGDSYQVRAVRGAAKWYVCPGCGHDIAPGTPHMVAWPEEAAFGHPQGVEARRHWHTHCWNRRLRPL